MPGQNKIVLFYGISALFLLIDFYFLLAKHTILVAFIPLVFAFMWLAFWRMDWLMLSVAFFTPLSVPLRELIPGISFDLNLPTEPLLVGMLILFGLRWVQSGSLDREIWKHPVTLAVMGYLLWMLLTCFVSTMPLVSFKFWLSKVWFVIPCYFLGVLLFVQNKNFLRFAGLYMGAFLLVIGYAWYRHVGFGLGNQQAAHFVMNPFYTDHTSYGAMLAFFIPLLLLSVFHRNFTPRFRWLASAILAIFIVALVLSYTRAAWLSLVVALGVWLIVRLKVRFRSLLIVFFGTIAIAFVFQRQILQVMERNSQESSDNLAAHVSSMTNISSDASNLERINRWSCAWRMFAEKPVCGWGPGTYMFQYAPFQLTRHRTIISTNSADVGNAHSEYMGALSETGFPGLLSLLVLVAVALIVAFRAYKRTDSATDRLLLLAAVLGLVTYFSHGFLNNFLDTDKAAVPVWAFVAMIVAVDLRTGAVSSK